MPVKPKAAWQIAPVDALPENTRRDLVNVVADEVLGGGYSAEEVYSNLFNLADPPYLAFACVDPRRVHPKDVGISRLAVQRYTTMMRAGVEFDPVLVSEGEILDGHHRRLAAIRARRCLNVADVSEIVNMDWLRWFSGARMVVRPALRR